MNYLNTSEATKVMSILAVKSATTNDRDAKDRVQRLKSISERIDRILDK